MAAVEEAQATAMNCVPELSQVSMSPQHIANYMSAGGLAFKRPISRRCGAVAGGKPQPFSTFRSSGLTLLRQKFNSLSGITFVEVWRGAA